MTRLLLIKLIDVGAFVGFWLLLSTGLLMNFTLPPRSGQASVLGLTRHDWGDLHFYFALVFVLLIALHLWLHASFIVTTLRELLPKATGTRWAVALGLALLSIGSLLFALMAPVVR